MSGTIPILLVYVLLCSFLQYMDALAVQKIRRAKRVYNGRVIEPNSRPWMALYKGKNTCTAFLINGEPHLFDDVYKGASDILLTAAHCVVGRHFKNADYDFLHYPNAVVAFGKHNQYIELEPNQVNIIAVRAIIPESYNGSSHDHDIAILKLERPVEFNEWIKPIALSNASIDNVRSCSMTGWGGSEVLSEKEFNRVIDTGLQYMVQGNSSDESYPIHGDSGSPMTCLDGNTLVAQGIMSHGSFKHGKTEKAWYTNIISHIPWIMDVYDDIKKDFTVDEVRYNVDISELSEFVTTFNDSGLTMEYLKYYCEGLGLDPSKQLENKLNLQLNQTEYEEMFFHGFDSKMTLKKHAFPFYNIIGYVEFSSIHACVSLCHQKNGEQVCSFVAPLKRCYLAHGEYINMPQIYIQRAISIFPKRRTFQGGNPRMHPNNFKSTILPSKVNIYQPESSISVWSVRQGGVYCPGRAVNVANLRFYVEVSTTCLALIGAKNVQTTDLAMEITNGTRTEVFNLRFNTTPEDDAVSRSSHMLNGTVLQSLEHGEVSLHRPKIAKFDSKEGAFALKPFTMPFIVKILGNCVGVLLNESSITAVGRSDRTKFVLTSGRCTKWWYDELLDTVEAGVYFFHFPNTDSQLREIFWSRTTRSKPWNSVQILELSNDVLFNDHVKPVLLAGDDSVLPLEPKFLRASRKSKLRGNPLSVVPLQLESPLSNVTTTFSIADDLVLQRRFNTDQQRQQYGYSDPVGDPLFVCGDIVQECRLLGFHKTAETVQDPQKDEFFTIRTYKKWMKKTIDSCLFEFLRI